jgi:aldehyde:ferredoxin oxidoreductase
MPMTRKLLRIDLTRQTVDFEEITRGQRMKYIGGRGLNMARLYEMTNPKTDPLGPDNVLLLGCGLLNGIYFGRMNISAKSPESGYLGDSNIGGYFPAELSRCGIGQIIVTGRSDEPVYLFIQNDTVEFKSAKGLWGNDTYQTQVRIRQELCSEDAKIVCIGPAGENRVRFAGVASGYKSMAGRTGMGAVFGSKNLKAIACKGDIPFTVHNPEALQKSLLSVTDKLMNTGWAKALGRYGSPLLLRYANEKGFISYRYHQRTSIGRDAEDLEAEALDKYTTGMVACSGCPVHCRHRYKTHSSFGLLKGEGPEYASISSFGNQIGNLGMEAVVHLVGICNRLGIDTIAAGSYLGWMMTLYENGIVTGEELGVPLEWGNMSAVETLLYKISKREGFGDILADGAFAVEKLPAAAKRYLMQIKNIAIEMTDERAVKAFALGLAVATRGCCHMRSRVSVDVVQYPRELLAEFYGGDVGQDYMDYTGKARMVHWHENFNAMIDSAGICRFASVFSSINAIDYRDTAEIIFHATGLEFDEEGLKQLGERIYTLERAYIAREGIRRKDDTLPDHYFDAPVPDGPSKGQHIDRAEFQKMLDQYYSLHGWDSDGVPTRETLERLGLAGSVL